MPVREKFSNLFYKGNLEEIDYATNENDGNSSIKQDEGGSPVEEVNPLGYNLNYPTAFFMVVQGMIGTGIFATPGTVVKSMGSIGSTYVLWVSGFLIVLAEVSVYIEYISYFKRRSGGDAAFLERAYPEPHSIAFGTYILLAAGSDSAWAARGVGGLVVLGGGTRVQNSHEVFKNAWEGTTTSGNAIGNAILKVSFSMGAYYAGIGSVEEISKAGTLVSSVFGTSAATKALDVLVALAAFGHLLATVIGQSRVLRECGRQGVLPYARLWTSTKPWGTPILPIIVIWVVNVIVSVAPPPGDAFNFVVDMGAYVIYIFRFFLVIGLLKIRKRRKAAGLGFEGWKVPLPILIMIACYELFVIAMAFVPPDDGTLKGSDVSFFYCAYSLACFGIIGLCSFYYFVWAKILPKMFKYEHRQSFYSLKNGEKGNTVVKVKYEDLEKWDAEHDKSGKLISDDGHSIENQYSASVENITVSISDKNKLFKA
ncbi:hypothetical protein QCA50_017185 [Cerrena zonata]|uniref:Uncharacterized protein n=1 Tax=Cerrena zonata TaxID=2478898 RepID=A0AAW0FDK6_9APHY